MATGPVLRKRLAVAVSLGLLLVFTATFLTGFVAAALDLNRFAYHKYAAYAAIGLATVHVLLHWRSLAGQMRRWLFGAARPVSPGAAGPAKPGPGPRLTRRTLLWPGVSLAAGAGLGQWWASRTRPPTLEEGEDLGEVYHQWSKPTYVGTLLKAVRPLPQPAPYKTYPGSPVLRLPPSLSLGGPPFEQVLARRRSVREYADRPVTLDELSRLLQASAGITDRRDPSLAFRAVPSSGALYPIEAYPILFNVVDAGPGVYHYAVEQHQLELVRAGNVREDVFRAALSQELVLHAALVLVLTGLRARVQWKYADRSYRYLMLEAGHLGQNVYLAATALGLGVCGVGAFFDDDLNRLLGVDGREEATVYLLAVGPNAG
jgi:SagB-type dehydrogenase family enzyme